MHKYKCKMIEHNVWTQYLRAAKTFWMKPWLFGSPVPIERLAAVFTNVPKLLQQTFITSMLLSKLSESNMEDLCINVLSVHLFTPQQHRWHYASRRIERMEALKKKATQREESIYEIVTKLPNCWSKSSDWMSEILTKCRVSLIFIDKYVLNLTIILYFCIV